MKKEKYGVTIVALGIIIIVLGLVISLLSINLSTLITETKAKEFASELKQLEFLINDYKIRNNGVIDFTSYTLNTSGLPDSFLEQLQGETILDDGNIELYRIDYVKIDAQDTKYGLEQTTSDIYLVSGETGKIYYVQGFKYNGNQHYTLTQELENVLGN